MGDHFNLIGKTAIITGGAGILGGEFSRALLSCGVNVVVADINKRAAENVVDSLSEDYPGGQLIAVECDVTDKSSIDHMIESAVTHYGDIDILHNNAATKGKDLKEFFKPFEEYSLDVWKEVMSVNIDGMFLVAQAVGKQMIKQGKGGSIIQTSSIYGASAPDQRVYNDAYYMDTQINSPAVYSASKAAVIALTQYLAVYWSNHNIRVNTLVPGGVYSGQNEEFRKNYSNRVPLARMAQKSEISGALLFLSSELSSYITGQKIVIDGGLTCW